MYISVTDGKQTLIVDSLSDFLFEEGFRTVVEIPKSKIDVHLYDETNRQLAIQQYGY
jgi:hypothetical protein